MSFWFHRATALKIGVSVLLVSLASLTYADAPTIAAADASFAQGKFDQARKTYASLVKTDPAQSAAECGLIQSLLRLDRWQEALRVSQAAVALTPANADERGLLAMAEIRAGALEDAQTDADKALASDKSNYWGLVAAGRVAAWNGHRKAGGELFAQATALHPERPDAWLGAWQTNEDPGMSEAALQIANHYLALSPKGQPFDFNTPYIQNVITNETGYWKSFATDTPFHLATDDKKQESYTAVFPIERQGNSVLVSVSIDGHPYHLLFDSGASGLLLSSNAARKLGLPELAKTYISGVQGKASAEMKRADTLSLGSITLHSIPLTVSSSVPDGTDGLFGGTLLDDYAVTLDFEDNTMTIARGPNAGHIARPHTSTATAPLHLYHSHLFVAAHVQNRRIWAMLDTGAYTDLFSLDLTHQLAKDTPHADWDEGSYDQRVGIGDSSTQIDYCKTPTKVTIALDGSVPPATITQEGLIGESAIDHQLSPSFDFEISLILGVPLLSQHSRVTIDYPHRLLTFEDPLP